MVGIKIANIYINFPEIMKEEYKDLWEFINEEHIVAKDVTKDVIDLKQRIDKAIDIISSNKFLTGFVHTDNFELREKELLSILRGEDND